VDWRTRGGVEGRGLQGGWIDRRVWGEMESTGWSEQHVVEWRAWGTGWRARGTGWRAWGGLEDTK
jgi:hypothetical protein